MISRQLRSVPVLPASAMVIALLMILLQAFGSGCFEALRFDHQSIASGQWWRLLTGNLVHWTWVHCAMNVAGLVMLAFIFSRDFEWHWPLLVLVVASISVGAGLYFFDPAIRYYAGFSGVLHGLLYFAVIAGWRRAPSIHLLVLAILIMRLFLEQGANYDINYLKNWIGVSVATGAHLAGAVSGGFLAIINLILRDRPI